MAKILLATDPVKGKFDYMVNTGFLTSLVGGLGDRGVVGKLD